MKRIRLSHPTETLRGDVRLPLSKSENNRLLIIRELCGAEFPIDALSDAEDTKTLVRILAAAKTGKGTGEVYDSGLAGTTTRFLAAYFSILPGTRVLTGSARMKERPIHILVDGLRALGAKIEYLGEPGFVPLKIEGGVLAGGEIEVDGSVSSQFVSALLLIAPKMHNGLVIHFNGPIVSRSYINMTIRIMERFGVHPIWSGNTLSVSGQNYHVPENEKRLLVEPDWSAASYWFSMAALATDVDLFIHGLHNDSLQGDRVTANLYDFFGVHATFEDGGVRLKKTTFLPKNIAFNFEDCPDIVQTVAVTASALKIPMLFCGINTLRIKETDRVAALQNEMRKYGVVCNEPEKGVLETTAFTAEKFPALAITTYNDHRMAMSFAPLALFAPVTFDDASVVEKSYPSFWEELKRLGFVIEEL
jgi:3-phosphoshikimate 1-carboxyvinyltransferase